MDSALALLIFLIAVTGTAVGALVLKSDHKRWDSKIFAAMCFVDSATEAMRAAYILDGNYLTAIDVQRSCLLGGIAIAYLTVEFVYSFPFDRRLSPKRRAVLAAACLLAVSLVLHPATSSWFMPKAASLFFLPIFVVTIYYLAQNYSRLKAGPDSLGIPLVMLAIGLRWTSSMATFLVARRISQDAFSFMLYFDATFSVFFCYWLAARSFMRYQLFRVRGMIADVVLYTGLAFTVTGVLYAAIELALARANGPMQLRAMLIGVALIPLGLYALGHVLLPKIEERILCPLDPRRVVMKSALAKLVHDTAGKVDPEEIVSATLTAMEEISCCGRVRLLEPGGDPPLEGPLAEHFAAMSDLHLHRPHARDLPESAHEALRRTPGDLFVAVRRAGKLYGALAIEGGDLDRETVHTAVALADHLALKLENYSLFSQMIALKGELEEAGRLASLGQFAAAIAHDIRTPLTSVQMNVQILRGKAGKAKLEPDDMEYFDIALEELKRLNSHICELLDYAKPAQLKTAPVDLRELADDAARGMEPILSDRKLQLLKEHPATLPQVLADPSRMRQVLVNLLDNAAQASAQGASIMVRTHSIDGGSIALEVSDSGKGIEAENLPKIFEPFFTTKADGTGLGLAIAQKLVKAQGGEIRVRSKLGEGSTFTIVLPAMRARDVTDGNVSLHASSDHTRSVSQP
jgi:signal transduction histidine kinase